MDIASSDKQRMIRRSRIVLVSMPFVTLHFPSMGLSMLKAALTKAGLPSHIFYAGFELAHEVGVENYCAIPPDPELQLEEWLFTRALFGEKSTDLEEYLQRVTENQILGFSSFSPSVLKRVKGAVQVIHAQIDSFLDRCQDIVMELRPELIGFSSTFQQQVGSLALAKRIKSNFPETFILFGGANCRSRKGIAILKQFPFVDAVVLGEADNLITDLAEGILARKNISHLRGVFTQKTHFPEKQKEHYPAAYPVTDLDSLPDPDFDDYFDQLNSYRLKLPQEARILFEASRGCWWGRCHFCGADINKSLFRSKSGPRAFEEFSRLSAKYPARKVQFTDNILDTKHYSDFIPKLAQMNHSMEIFLELKSNVKKKHLILLRDAGARTLQPGIESLSTPILNIMGKGVSGIQNIQFLKWCGELGIEAFWNFLWGFPGEPVEEYDRLARLIPFLVHLKPPRLARLYICSFSHYQDNPQTFGFTNIRPLQAYRSIYPFEKAQVEELAQYYVYDYKESPRDENHVKLLKDAVENWNLIHGQSFLFHKEEEGRLLIWDQRPVAKNTLTVLSGIEKDILLTCESLKKRSKLRKHLLDRTGVLLSDRTMEKAVEFLEGCGLLMSENEHVLSLSIPANPHYPGNEIMSRFEDHLIRMGRQTLQARLGGKIKIEPLDDNAKVAFKEIKKFK